MTGHRSSPLPSATSLPGRLPKHLFVPPMPHVGPPHYRLPPHCLVDFQNTCLSHPCRMRPMRPHQCAAAPRGMENFHSNCEFDGYFDRSPRYGRARDRSDDRAAPRRRPPRRRRHRPVYMAEHAQLGDRVAVNILLPSLPVDRQPLGPRKRAGTGQHVAVAAAPRRRASASEPSFQRRAWRPGCPTQAPLTAAAGIRSIHILKGRIRYFQRQTRGMTR
jgi:hypothetical protein